MTELSSHYLHFVFVFFFVFKKLVQPVIVLTDPWLKTKELLIPERTTVRFVDILVINICYHTVSNFYFRVVPVIRLQGRWRFACFYFNELKFRFPRNYTIFESRRSKKAYENLITFVSNRVHGVC